MYNCSGQVAHQRYTSKTTKTIRYPTKTNKQTYLIIIDYYITAAFQSTIVKESKTQNSDETEAQNEDQNLTLSHRKTASTLL